MSCKGLKEITIPESVISIGSNAFNYSGLSTLYMKAQTPPSIDVTKRSIPINVDAIYVPKGRSEIYKVEWYEYADKIQEYNF